MFLVLVVDLPLPLPAKRLYSAGHKTGGQPTIQQKALVASQQLGLFCATNQSGSEQQYRFRYWQVLD